MSHPKHPSFLTTSEIEWLSPKQAVRQFSISRSYLYLLMRAGHVKSRSLRVLGNIRGKRLISAESLRLFLHSQPEGFNP